MKNYVTIPLYENRLSTYVPEMYLHFPQNIENKAKAVIICGGGGFNKVNLDHEGHQFAEWLNSFGIVGCVLNYTLPKGKDKRVTEKDLRQAIKIVKANAGEWGIDKENIGAAGFSIGGHAVALVAAKEEQDLELDFTILFYSVTSMEDALTHIPSRTKLLGVDLSEEDIYNFSPLNHISAKTPPSFIMACNDDKVVSPMNSVLYYERLRKYKIPASLYIFPEGGHGWGMSKDFKYQTEMLSLLEKWLKSQL